MDSRYSEVLFLTSLFSCWLTGKKIRFVAKNRDHDSEVSTGFIQFHFDDFEDEQDKEYFGSIFFDGRNIKKEMGEKASCLWQIFNTLKTAIEKHAEIGTAFIWRHKGRSLDTMSRHFSQIIIGECDLVSPILLYSEMKESMPPEEQLLKLFDFIELCFLKRPVTDLYEHGQDLFLASMLLERFPQEIKEAKEKKSEELEKVLAHMIKH